MDEEIEQLHALVDAFAEEMKAKLTDKALQGYWGWDDAHFGPRLRQSLLRHVERGAGQEVDIANLAMFLWWHQHPSETIAALRAVPPGGEDING